MPRLARVVAAAVPHHVMKCGSRWQPTLFSDDDCAAYRDLTATACRHGGVEIWAYCLMPNHVHLIAVPATGDGLALGIGEARRRSSRMINDREG